jgi:hypothetical protein
LRLRERDRAVQVCEIIERFEGVQLARMKTSTRYRARGYLIDVIDTFPKAETGFVDVDDGVSLKRYCLVSRGSSVADDFLSIFVSIKSKELFKSVLV